MAWDDEHIDDWRSEASPEYVAAHDAMVAAERDYRRVVEAYRARRVGDAEYLAARAVNKAAADAFEAAYRAEECRAVR